VILENYQILDELLEEFRQEKTEIDMEIEYNDRYIKRADVVLKEFKNLESEDYKVFSPRRIEIVHKEEIEQADKEKSKYEEKNRDLSRKKNILNERIIKLEKILKEQDYDSMLLVKDGEERKSGEKLQSESIKRLIEIFDKIDSGSHYLEQNQVVQARQEFMIIKKSLSDLLEIIKSSLWISKTWNE